MVKRSGHSIPELVVALVFIAVALAAVAAGTLLAYRSTVAAVRRQNAVVLTAALLDSLLAAPDIAAGHRTLEGLRSEWRITPVAGGLVVEVASLTDPGAAELARMEGFWLPTAPMLAAPVGAVDDASGAP
jgi:Tfp pilus assembly protein PilV